MEANALTMTEMTRFILGLRSAGWSEEMINNFLLYIESGDERYRPVEKPECSRTTNQK